MVSPNHTRIRIEPFNPKIKPYFFKIPKLLTLCYNGGRESIQAHDQHKVKTAICCYIQVCKKMNVGVVGIKYSERLISFPSHFGVDTQAPANIRKTGISIFKTREIITIYYEFNKSILFYI